MAAIQPADRNNEILQIDRSLVNKTSNRKEKRNYLMFLFIIKGTIVVDDDLIAFKEADIMLEQLPNGAPRRNIADVHVALSESPELFLDKSTVSIQHTLQASHVSQM